MIIAGGFVLGEVLTLLTVEIGIIYLGAIMALSILWIRTQKRRSEILLLIFCGLVGFIRLDYETEIKYQIPEAEQNVIIEGKILEINQKSSNYEIRMDQIRINGEWLGVSNHQALLVLSRQQFNKLAEQEPIRIGMKIEAAGTISLFDQARNPGEFDLRQYYRANQLIYRIKGENSKVINYRYDLILDIIDQMRQYASEHLKRVCEVSDLGVFLSAILGDKSQLDGDVKELYQKNGIAHLLAISGLHISLIGMGMYKGFRKVGLGYGGAGLGSAVLMICYGILTGNSASVFRSVCMFLCAVFASYLGRTYDLLSALALSAVLVLWERPLLITQASFQLSYAAVFAIAGVSSWLIKYLEIETGWKKSLVTNLSIQLITYPILLFHYYQYPLYSILLNLIVVPLMAFILISGLTSILVGWCSVYFSKALLGAGHYTIQIYEVLCRLFERLPCYNVILGKPKAGQVVAYYVIIGLILFGVKHIEKLEYRRNLCLLILLAVLCLCQFPVSGMRVTFLDVGQGDGILLETKDCTMLFDGGSTDVKEVGKRRIEPYLKYRGIRMIDYVFISHGDQDHINGISYLLNESNDITIKNLVLPYHGKNDPVYYELGRAVRKSGGRVYWISPGDFIEQVNLKISCLYPGAEHSIDERNDHSPLLLVSYKQFQMLLTGDMSSAGESEVLRNHQLLEAVGQIHVLKLAHHGSKYSNSEEWIFQIKPLWAVVSYGQRNTYGHPHREILDRMQVLEVPLWETGKQGAIVFQTDGRTIKWNSFLN